MCAECDGSNTPIHIHTYKCKGVFMQSYTCTCIYTRLYKFIYDTFMLVQASRAANTAGAALPKHSVRQGPECKLYIYMLPRFKQTRKTITKDIMQRTTSNKQNSRSRLNAQMANMSITKSEHANMRTCSTTKHHTFGRRLRCARSVEGIS